MASNVCLYKFKNECQSCSLLDESGRFDIEKYKLSIIQKQNQIKSHFSEDLVQEFIVSPEIIHFRNKAKFSFFKDAKENIQLGYFSENLRFHELASCSAHQKNLERKAKEIRDFFCSNPVSIYSPHLKQGELKNLILIEGDGEIGVKFILRSPALRSKIKKYLKDSQFPLQGVAYVVINYQPDHSSILEGLEEELVWGKPYLNFLYGKVKLKISPKSFNQVNTLLASVLYQTFSLQVRQRDHKYILDLFCGAGGFLFSVGNHITNGIGIEISKPALNIANTTLQEQKIINLKFQDYDLTQTFLLEPLIVDWDKKKTAIVVNPPRRGLGQDLSSVLNDSGVQNIYYSSCSLESLLKDLEQFTKYSIEFVQGFDMFPWTNHMEVFVILKLKASFI